jgi:hypothetical protein
MYRKRKPEPPTKGPAAKKPKGKPDEVQAVTGK